MTVSGNKGEWSEIYTLFKLLGDKKLHIGDESQNKIEKLFYPILQILRKEQTKQFIFSITNDNVVISIDESDILTLSCDEFQEKALVLLHEIKKGTNSFSITEIEKFMSSFQSTRLKAVSSDKADIKILIHDIQTQTTPLLGFSIKSRLGGDSTLVNAGKTTNFRFVVENIKFTSEQIERINSINTKSKIKDRIEAIINSGGTFKLDSVCNKTFDNNLKLIDSALPSILGDMLLEKNIGKKSTIKDLCQSLEQRNPLHFDLQGNPYFYSYKIKRFLLESALGLMPSKVWTGKYDANGGYIIVKEDGDIICYHIYNKNLFEEYLFKNTKLETASSERHEFGKLEQENDELYFKLNLQVRFL